MQPSATTSAAILVVEDNATNLLLVRTVLERAGFHVVTAHSAEDAAQQLQHITPDLILMDVGLPGQDGLSLTRALKSTPETAAIAIVALTAHAMRSDQERALAAGCDGYVSKPFKGRQLVDEINRVLTCAQTTPTPGHQSDR